MIFHCEIIIAISIGKRAYPRRKAFSSGFWFADVLAFLGNYKLQYHMVTSVSCHIHLISGYPFIPFFPTPLCDSLAFTRSLLCLFYLPKRLLFVIASFNSHCLSYLFLTFMTMVSYLASQFY